MNDALKMQISAYLDGELPENESELLLRRLGQDAELRQQISHYLQIGRLLRREPEVRGMEHLRGRIAASLGEVADEPVAVVPETRKRYTRLMAGAAIAASVALLGLFTLQQVGLQDVPDADRIANGIVDNRSGETFATEPAVDELLDHRLLDEMRWRHAGSSDAGSADIRTRLVSLESREVDWVEIEPKSAALEDDSESQDDTAANPADGSSETRPAE
jgi:hypothetical protein